MNPILGILIASCIVTTSPNPEEIDSVLYVYKKANNTVAVSYGKSDKLKNTIANEFKFSKNNNVLELVFFKHVTATILRGIGTHGKMGVMLGAKQSDIVCTGDWE